MAYDEPPKIGLMRLAVKETHYYIIFGGLILLVLFASLLALLTPSIVWLGLGGYAQVVGRVAVFAGALFICGIPANVAFVALLRGRMYVPADPTVDWLPWLPWAEWTVDTCCGGRYVGSASPRVWLAWWFAFAVPTWSGAFFLYGKLSAAW